MSKSWKVALGAGGNRRPDRGRAASMERSLRRPRAYPGRRQDDRRHRFPSIPLEAYELSGIEMVTNVYDRILGGFEADDVTGAGRRRCWRAGPSATMARRSRSSFAKV